MVHLYPCLHFAFKDLSNDTSQAQIRVKMKKLWPKEEKKLLSITQCRDTLSVSRHWVMINNLFSSLGHNFFILTWIWACEVSLEISLNLECNHV